MFNRREQKPEIKPIKKETNKKPEKGNKEKPKKVYSFKDIGKLL